MIRVHTFATFSLVRTTPTTQTSTVVIPVTKTKNGDSLILRAYGSGGETTAIEDSKSHSWTQIHHGGLSIFYCLSASAFEPGDTITLTGGIGAGSVVIVQGDEYPPFSAVDRTAQGFYGKAPGSQYGDRKHPTSGPTLLTVKPNEVLIGAISGWGAPLSQVAIPPFNFMPEPGWENVSAIIPFIQANTKYGHGLFCEDFQVGLCGQYAATGVFSLPLVWEAIIVTFKLVPVPEKPQTLREFAYKHSADIPAAILGAFVFQQEVEGILVGKESEWLVAIAELGFTGNLGPPPSVVPGSTTRSDWLKR